LAVRTKTDARDSQVLARYGALVHPPRWQPATPEIRELNALIARLDAVEADLRRERNRQEKAEGVPLPTTVAESLQQHIDFLEQEATRLQTAIHSHIDQYPPLRQDRDLLQSIPAIGEKTAQRLLAVLHSRDLTSADQVTAFLGLVPVECQSGSSLHRHPRLSKVGAPRIRAALYMAAVVATRHTPHIQALYQRLIARGKAKMAALWVPPCANWCNWRSGSSNISNLTRPIGLPPLDCQDGIYVLLATFSRIAFCSATSQIDGGI
jgi:transposase